MSAQGLGGTCFRSYTFFCGRCGRSVVFGGWSGHTTASAAQRAARAEGWKKLTGIGWTCIRCWKKQTPGEAP